MKLDRAWAGRIARSAGGGLLAWAAGCGGGGGEGAGPVPPANAAASIATPPGAAPSNATSANGAPACDAAWLAAPSVDAPIAPPAGAVVLLHMAATGAQLYTCARGADGAAAWTPSGPDADLADCHGAHAGHHFSGQGGAPEWQTADGAFVLAKKAAATPAHDATSVPWLLLQATAHGGDGAISKAEYVQRVNTRGGAAPIGTCEPGATTRVPYTADYYFVGPAR